MGLVWALSGLVCAQAESADSRSRVFLLGVDGMDHQLTVEFMEQGHLPNMKALAKQGSLHPLLPTNPAQSPVSWASMITGEHPQRTRIYGFLRPSFEDGHVVPRPSMLERGEKKLLSPGLKFGSYLGALAVSALPLLLMRRRRRLALFLALFLAAMLLVIIRWFSGVIPERIPVPLNRREGVALWKGLDAEGIKTITLGAPCGFPAEELDHGHLLCGLGVPDIMGTFGTAWMWQEDVFAESEATTMMGGRRLQLLREPGSKELGGAEFWGPLNPMDPSQRMTVPVSVELQEAQTVRVRWQEKELDLALDEFSPLTSVWFSWSDSTRRIKALARLRLMQVEPTVRIYVEPLQPDPESILQWAALCTPEEYGKELAADGLFETVGWPTATNPMNDGLIDRKAFLDDVNALVKRRHKMILHEMEQRDWGLFFAVLSTPDRVQHMFWCDRDPEHPAHDPAVSQETGDVILESYKAVDHLVGEVLSKLGLKDHFFLVSDHGFAPFRHAVNLNRWLVQEGYLTLKPTAEPTGRNLSEDLEGQGAFRDVDWSKTRAYHMGLGRIWINKKGREPKGIVSADEADGLAAEIADKLLSWKVEDKPIIKSARLAEDLYGADRVAPAESGDIIVGFHRGYRVSWNACLGGVSEPLLFPNLQRWSGDHCSVDPELVQGVLLSRQGLESSGHVVDVYPTVRRALGLEPLGDLPGRALLKDG